MYDERLAERVRKSLAGRKKVTERRMFGGVAFMLDGKMFCGVINDDLVIRTGPESYERALAKPHARPMDFTGRPMRGFVYVGSGGCKTGKTLSAWVDSGIKYVVSLKKETDT